MISLDMVKDETKINFRRNIRRRNCKSVIMFEVRRLMKDEWQERRDQRTGSIGVILAIVTATIVIVSIGVFAQISNELGGKFQP